MKGKILYAIIIFVILVLFLPVGNVVADVLCPTNTPVSASATSVPSTSTEVPSTPTSVPPTVIPSSTPMVIIPIIDPTPTVTRVKGKHPTQTPQPTMPVTGYNLPSYMPLIIVALVILLAIMWLARTIRTSLWRDKYHDK